MNNAVSNKKIKIISLANQSYVDFLKGNIKSFLHHYGKCEIEYIVYLVNCNKKDIDYFKNILPEDNIKILNIDFSKKQCTERQFCGNYRNKIMKDNFSNDSILIWIDADALFLKKSDRWLNLIFSDTYDILSYKFHNGIILSGIIVCNNTPRACSFLEEYSMIYDPYNGFKGMDKSKKSKKIRKKIWMMDQNKYSSLLMSFSKNDTDFRNTHIGYPIYLSKIYEDCEIEKIEEADIWLPIREKNKSIFQNKLNYYINL